jgi:anti-anti-sigma factor
MARVRSTASTASSVVVPPGGPPVAVRQERVTVLALTGELDLATAALVRDALERIGNADAREETGNTEPSRLVIDLSELSVIDSAGMQLILSEHPRLDGRDVPRLKIRRRQRTVSRF